MTTGGLHLRFALAFTLSAALCLLQATAQTLPQQRPFVDADYDSYFAPSVLRFESPTYKSQGIEQRSLSTGTGIISLIEVLPKLDPASLYPFIKVRATLVQRPGVWDKTLKARVYVITAADFDDYLQHEAWLSLDKHTEVSPRDARIGSLRGYNRALAKARGESPEEADKRYREGVVGKWALRCAFLTGDTYEAECTQTKLANGDVVVRRYFRQTKIG